MYREVYLAVRDGPEHAIKYRKGAERRLLSSRAEKSRKPTENLVDSGHVNSNDKGVSFPGPSKQHHKTANANLHNYWLFLF